MGSVANVVGAALVRCSAGVVAERLCTSTALVLANLKQPMHGVLVLREMAANARNKLVPILAIGSSLAASQTHLSDVSWLNELPVKTGQGRVGHRKVKYTMVE